MSIPRLTRPFALAALLCLATTAVQAQIGRRGLPGGTRDSAGRPPQRQVGTVDGIVSDTALAPIQGAEVKLLSTNVKVNTGPSGRFRISDVPAGQYVLIVRRVGYSPASVVIDVAANDTLNLSYALERSATSLAAATVTAERTSIRLSEFDQRRRSGRGEFMTQDQIEKRPAVYATDLMRRFMTINVSPSSQKASGGMPDQYALSRREGGSILGATGGGNGYCAMAVYVDEIKMPTPFNLDLLPSPRLLAGIEVYAGPATIPAKWAGPDNGCGIILIWTRDGTK